MYPMGPVDVFGRLKDGIKIYSLRYYLYVNISDGYFNCFAN